MWQESDGFVLFPEVMKIPVILIEVIDAFDRNLACHAIVDNLGSLLISIDRTISLILNEHQWDIAIRDPLVRSSNCQMELVFSPLCRLGPATNEMK